MVLSLWKQLADVVKTKGLHALAAKHSFYGDNTRLEARIRTYSLWENPREESSVIIKNTFEYGFKARAVALREFGDKWEKRKRFSCQCLAQQAGPKISQ